MSFHMLNMKKYLNYKYKRDMRLFAYSVCSIICMWHQPMVIIRHQFVRAHIHRFCFLWECAYKYLITFLCCSCVLALDRG